MGGRRGGQGAGGAWDGGVHDGPMARGEGGRVCERWYMRRWMLLADTDVRRV